MTITFKTFGTIITVLLLSYSSSFAQSNFVAAKITQLNGVVLDGQIDDKSWLINPDSIFFRYNSSSKAQIFKPKDIAGFEIVDKKIFYEAKTVELNFEPVMTNNLEIYSSMNEARTSKKHLIKGQYFLYVLSKGAINLYEYFDNKTKYHYIIQKGNEPPIELVNRRFYVVDGQNMNQFHALPYYQEQLKQYLADSKALTSHNFKQEQYTNKSLLALINKYNESMGKSSFKSENSSKRGESSKMVLLGAELGRFEYQDAYYQTSIVKSIASSIGFSQEFKFAKKNGKVGLGYELRYSLNNFEKKLNLPAGGYINYDFKLSHFNALLFTSYHFNLDDFSKLYLKFGANTLFYPKSKGTETLVRSGTDISTNTKNLIRWDEAVFVGIGFKMKKILLEARFQSSFIDFSIGQSVLYYMEDRTKVGLFAMYEF